MSGKARSKHGTVEAVVFRFIRAHGPVKPKVIAEELGMTKCATWKAVQRLRERGAIQRVEKAHMIAIGKQAPRDNRGWREASKWNLSIKHRRRGLPKYITPPPVVRPSIELEKVWPL